MIVKVQSSREIFARDFLTFSRAVKTQEVVGGVRTPAAMADADAPPEESGGLITEEQIRNAFRANNGRASVRAFPSRLRERVCDVTCACSNHNNDDLNPHTSFIVTLVVLNGQPHT